jgi:hypothetical protein
MSQLEYAEETIFWSLKTAKEMSARRRTTSFYLTNTSDGSPTSYDWRDNTGQVWTELKALLERHDPKIIAINADRETSFSSGLHAGELEAISAGLGEKWTNRFVVVPMLAVEYVGTQIEARLPWYRKIQETAWAIISEAFSEKVITPGITTADDVEWWMREKILDLRYGTWFHPDVTIVKEGFPWAEDTESALGSGGVIEYGDYLHVDFGVTAMGLNTDTQHLGYVLYPGETGDDVPDGLKEGLRKGNRMQDIVREHMKPGMTGNEILKASLKQLREEGINGSIYCHPIGDWGHSAGTLIGKLKWLSAYPPPNLAPG